MGLTVGELTGMREAIALLLPDTCSILQMVQSQDGEGNITSVGSAIATAIPCRVDSWHRGYLAVSGAAIEPFSRYTISMAYNQSVNEANKIKVGNDVYRVTGVNTDQSWKAVLRVDVEREI